MGWFEEQIKLRKQNDQDVFEESIFSMASAVLGQKGAGKLNDFRLLKISEPLTTFTHRFALTLRANFSLPDRLEKISNFRDEVPKNRG